MAIPKSNARKAFAQQRLRQRAEDLLRQAPEHFAAVPAGELPALLHELRVYRAELEMQNEELQSVQLDLTNSRDRFALLYDQAPVGYLTLDLNGIVQEANLTAARFVGVDRQVLLQKRLSRFIAEESQDELYLHLRQVFSTGAKGSCELKWRPRGAPAFIGRLESVAMPGELELPRHCLVALSDVTRHREAEAALQESQARLAGIVRLAMDAIILVDSRQRIVLFNEAAEKMFSRAPGEVIGQPLNILIPLRFRQSHARHVESFGRSDLVRRHTSERGELWGLRADGSEFPIEASISQLESGGKKFYTVILRDISSRLQKEKSLRQSERALADFFNEAPLSLVWVAADGQILRVNRALLELLGYNTAAVLGHNIGEFDADSEIVPNLLQRLAGKETVSNCRMRFRARSGTLVHVLVDANGLWEGEQLVHTRWFIRDISWRVQLEREILKTGEREKQLLGQELHDDLCQQLSSIEYLSHSLSIDLKAKCKASAKRAAEIARLLRQANTRTRELSHSLTPLPPGTEGLIGALKDLARRTCAVFHRDCRFHCPKPVRIDQPEVRQHLYRIAQEAVGNAIKHGKATRIDIRLSRNGNRLILGIQDNGLGLPRNAEKRKKGMGLRIMQYRAAMVSGSIVVQREPNGGTAVVCSVPDNVKPKARKNP
jgi:PAS domain S-box-containing protein